MSHFILEAFIQCLLNELDTHFYLPIPLILVWWWYYSFYVQVSAQFLEILWNEMTICICNYSLRWFLLWQKWPYILVLNWLPIHFLSFDGNLLWQFYSAKVMPFVKRAHVYSNYFLWFPQYLMMNYSFFSLCLLNIKTCRPIFMWKDSWSMYH